MYAKHPKFVHHIVRDYGLYNIYIYIIFYYFNTYYLTQKKTHSYLLFQIKMLINRFFHLWIK